MTLFEEYKNILKDPLVEEFFDTILFRPFAFLIVKLISRFPITPNQLSLSSMVFGLGSGLFFSIGTRTSFVMGGIFAALARVLDCSDGALARVKNKFSATGRILDGTVDYVNGTAIFVGLLIGLSQGEFYLPVSPWLLVAPAAFFMILHSITVDYYKMGFMSHGLGKGNSPSEEYLLFSQKLKDLKSGKKMSSDRLLILAYIKYLKVQIKLTPKRKKYDLNSYYRMNKSLIGFWALLGSSTYIFILFVSSLFGNPMIFFYYAFLFANSGYIILLIMQFLVNKKTDALN